MQLKYLNFKLMQYVKRGELLSSQLTGNYKGAIPKDKDLATNVTGSVAEA